MSEGIRDIKSNVILSACGDGLVFPFPAGGEWVVGAYNGGGKDLSECQAGAAFFQAYVGIGSTVTVKVQDSADNVTFADLAAANYGTGAAPVTITANGLYYFTFKNLRRYARIVVTVAVANLNGLFGGAIFERSRDNPIAQLGTEI